MLPERKARRWVDTQTTNRPRRRLRTGIIIAVVATAVGLAAGTQQRWIGILPTKTADCTVASVKHKMVATGRFDETNRWDYQTNCGDLNATGKFSPLPTDTAVGVTYRVRYSVVPLWRGEIASARGVSQ